MTVLLTKEAVTDRLRNLSIPLDSRVGEASPEQWRYREAAAVLASFDPAKLKPTGRSRGKAGEGFVHLVNDIVLSYDSDGAAIWSLRSDVRRATLERLGDRKRLIGALKANPNRYRDALQVVFEDYIHGKGKPLHDLSRDALANVLQVSEWLQGIIPGIPERKKVRRQLDLMNLLAPLTSLVGQHFRGRQHELELVREYVFNPDSLKRSHLAVVGIGGTGKSTLISKFILDHTSEPQSDRGLAFVYLDFDRPMLLPDQPITLLIEASKQLEVQYPLEGERFKTLRDRWQATTLLPSVMTSGQSVFTEALIEDAPKDLVPYIREFDAALTATGVRHLLLVLDTFEEVQYQGGDLVAHVFEFLDLLRRNRSGVRTILVSRSDLVQPDTETLMLGDLDLEAATGFLNSHGVLDARMARQIIERVGGNPLSLALAAEVVRKEAFGVGWDLPAFGVQQELIQGQLYRRILQHIHNTDVRKIAHPGLVLRRINPDIILQVLARPCGLTVKGQNQAEELFRELKREDTLVFPTEDGSVEHRPDVRKVMLNLLLRDEPRKVREIREEAVKYYSLRNDVLSRAEEIYHRLSLDQDIVSINARWTDGVEAYLRGAIQELPTRAKLYLASKLDIEIEQDIWQSAPLIEWEHRTERRAEELLQLDHPREVLEVLKERQERVAGSRLYLIEAQAYQRLHRTSKANAVAEIGLSEAERCGDGTLMLDHLSFLAALKAEAKQYARCTDLMNRAYSVAKKIGDNTRLLEVGLSRLVLGRLDGALSKSTIAASEDELAELVQSITDEELLRASDLVVDVASEVGASHRAVLRRVIRVVGLPDVSPNGLAKVLATWDAELAMKSGSPSDLATMAGFASSPGGSRRWLEFVKSAGVSSVVQVVRSLLVEHGLTDKASKQLAQLIRERPSTRKTAVKRLTARKRAIRRLRSARKASRKK